MDKDKRHGDASCSGGSAHFHTVVSHLRERRGIYTDFFSVTPCLSYTTATVTMWNGLNVYSYRSGVLLSSSQRRGCVVRSRTIHSRTPTYAFSSIHCSSAANAPASNNRITTFGSIPSVLGVNLRSSCCKGGYSGIVCRGLRYHSACSGNVSTNISTTKLGNCSSDQWTVSPKPTDGDHRFIWRTTKDRFIDFCLSPEEEARLKMIHERIIASSWSSVTAEEVTECLFSQEEQEKALQRSLLHRLYHFWSYILSPRGLQEDGRRLFRTLIPCYEDTMLTAKYFGIGEADFNGRIYFLLVHVWSLHCALQNAGLETLKIKLWDALWDFLTNILIQEGVSEFRIAGALREQQLTSLGFCVSLDEAFEDEGASPTGQLAHRLWVTVFDAKEERRDCPELMALTTYSSRARSFALKLPRDALIMGAFRWPAWPPAKSVESCQANGPKQK